MNIQRDVRLWVALGMAAACGSSAGQSIHSLGQNVIPFDISADGTTVVGRRFFNWAAVRWTFGGGLEVITTGGQSTFAHATSADGTVVVGEREVSSAPWGYRWTPTTGLEYLGSLIPGVQWSSATGVSADGNVVVGLTAAGGTMQPFRWTPQTGMVGLGLLTGGDFGRATDVTPDGQVIVGRSGSSAGYQAFRWTHTGGMIGLGDVPGGLFDSNAEAVSADGGVIVGHVTGPSGILPAYWQGGTGWTVLPLLPGMNRGTARGVTADGMTIVGYQQFAGAAESVPFLWNPQHGTRHVQEFLLAHGINLSDWTITDVFAISADGTRLAGTGMYLGTYTGWVAVIPPPGAAALFVVAALKSCRRRRLMETGNAGDA